MIIKKLVLLFVVLSVLMSGCLNSGEDQEQEEDDSGGSSGGTQRYEEVQTPEETITSEEMETPVETEPFEEVGTPQETEIAEETELAEEMLTPGAGSDIEEEQIENVTDEGEEETEPVQSAETEPRTYLVRLRDYIFIPSELEINTGDMVVWRNFEESSVFTLSSEEGLFEDQRLRYGNTLNYTFNETGSYNFNAHGYPNMQMTITVK